MLQSEAITIQFSYEENEFIRNSRDFYLRYYFTRVIPILGIIELLYFAFLLTINAIDLGSIWWYLVAGLGVLAILSTIASFIQPYLSWRKVEQRGNKFIMGFSEADLYSKNQIAESRIKWDPFKKVKESETAFLISYGLRNVVIIPKRALTPQQTDSLRELLRRKVGF